METVESAQPRTNRLDRYNRSALLASAWAKLDRARTHASEMSCLLNDAFSNQRQTITVAMGPDGESVLRVNGLPQEHTGWALVFGDMVHNLRSSLDHLANQCVLRDGCHPTERTQFPILAKPPNNAPTFKHGCTANDGRHASTNKLLEALQPYSSWLGTGKDLALVNELDNIDKHRLLVQCSSAIAPTRCILTHAEGARPEVAFTGFHRTLSNGDEVASVSWPSEASFTAFQQIIGFQAVLDHPSNSMTTGLGLERLAEIMLDAVEDTLELFGQLFGEPLSEYRFLLDEILGA